MLHGDTVPQGGIKQANPQGRGGHLEARIIQDDYINVGPLSSDLLLVDPPYSLKKTYDGVKESIEYHEWVSDLVARFDAPWKIFFAPPIDDAWLSKIPKPDRIIYWCKTFVQLRRLKWWQYAVTPILVYRAPDAPWYGATRGEKRVGAGLSHFDWIIAPSAMADIKATKKYYPDSHPGVTGTKVAREIIINTTKPGDTVLDPMCGLGSIPVAALREGRNAVGIEISPLYADVARKWANDTNQG